MFIVVSMFDHWVVFMEGISPSVRRMRRVVSLGDFFGRAVVRAGRAVSGLVVPVGVIWARVVGGVGTRCGLVPLARSSVVLWKMRRVMVSEGWSWSMAC